MEGTKLADLLDAARWTVIRVCRSAREMCHVIKPGRVMEDDAAAAHANTHALARIGGDERSS